MANYSDSYLDINKRVAKAVNAAGMKEVIVDYSAYDTDGDDEPIDNLDKRAARGKIRLIKKADPFWGGDMGGDYQSEILREPTWLQVAVCANAMILKTCDRHHCFLEGIEPASEQIEKGVTIYRFMMGS